MVEYKYGVNINKKDIVEFAASKLLGGAVPPATGGEITRAGELACLANRPALRFNSGAQQTQLQQAAHHMRMCITMGEGNETAVTVAASEPILAEASAFITTRYGGTFLGS
ncbi:hypothetical protein DXG01_014064 [Tephrocybe rancida]|nr:hypothetical protein DXG01_014064 [Tephrocybe rancida]